MSVLSSYRRIIRSAIKLRVSVNVFQRLMQDEGRRQTLSMTPRRTAPLGGMYGCVAAESSFACSYINSLPLANIAKLWHSDN